MIYKVYSVFDGAAEAYLQPFFTHNRGSAIRSFTDAVNDHGHQFHRHAADYTLFEIGSYDDQSGKFISYDVNENLGNAVEFLRKEVQQAA